MYKFGPLLSKPFSSDFQPHVREVKLVILASTPTPCWTPASLPSNMGSLIFKSRFIKQKIFTSCMSSIGSKLAATQKDLSSTLDSSGQGGSPVFIAKTAILPQKTYKTCTFSLLLTNAHTEVTSDELRSTT